MKSSRCKTCRKSVGGGEDYFRLTYYQVDYEGKPEVAGVEDVCIDCWEGHVSPESRKAMHKVRGSFEWAPATAR